MKDTNIIGLTQMKELFPFLWCFVPAKLAQNTREKQSSALPKSTKRCVRKFYITSFTRYNSGRAISIRVDQI